MQLNANPSITLTMTLSATAAGPVATPAPTTPTTAQTLMVMQALLAIMRLIKAQAAPAGATLQQGDAAPVDDTGVPLITAEAPRTDGPVATGRPPGDLRTAEQIMNDPANAVLKNLGHQKDIKRDLLTQRLGDLNDPDPDRRADAAYNWAGTLNNVKSLAAYDGSDRGAVHANGKIEGITHDGDARHGTEAGVLKDFAETGAWPADGRLPTTNDTHVRKNGTNKSNLQWGLERLGKFITGALSSVFKTFANVIGCTLGKIPGIGKFLSAPAELLAKGISDGFAVANVAIGGGDTKAAAREMGLDMLDTVVSTGVGFVDPSGAGAARAGQAARDAADPDGTSSADALKLSFS